MSLTQKVIDANVAVHSRLAAHYESCEPHFRLENVAKVEHRIAALVSQTKASSLLDLGCGTGFVVNIAKRHVQRIVGVDVTPAMLEKVDRSGVASVEVVQQDTGTYSPQAGSFQIVTAYSFLHHLAERTPTFRTAHHALGPGGKFYADLDPNFYFWDSIRALDPGAPCHPLVKREIDAVTLRGGEIETQFGVTSDTFNHAEFGKNMDGGFKEDRLRDELCAAGFKDVVFHYEWFLGEGFLINSGAAPREQLLAEAATINAALQRALPVSRNLFKYLGFVATK
jgi:ubiquinone/menaquinone biosynthesis C-methylase UbiE